MRLLTNEYEALVCDFEAEGVDVSSDVLEDTISLEWILNVNVYYFFFLLSIPKDHTYFLTQIFLGGSKLLV